MKTCFKCHLDKPLAEFYKHAMMRDGHLNKCILCTCKDRRLYKKKNKAAILAYQRSKNKENMRKGHQKYPEKFRARWRVKKALKSGRLKRLPCEKCGKKPAHGHHEDYSKPLQVVWLCQKHHVERHLEIRRGF